MWKARPYQVVTYIAVQIVDWVAPLQQLGTPRGASQLSQCTAAPILACSSLHYSVFLRFCHMYFSHSVNYISFPLSSHSVLLHCGPPILACSGLNCSAFLRFCLFIPCYLSVCRNFVWYYCECMCCCVCLYMCAHKIVYIIWILKRSIYVFVCLCVCV